MPWIGLRPPSDRVIPEEVEDGERVFCLGCRMAMYPRGPTTDGRARHFFHATSGLRECPGPEDGGESDTHRKWKSMAVSALKQYYEPTVRRCGPEVTLDVSDTDSNVDERRADAFLSFDGYDGLLGKGVIVEVQYGNKNKDLQTTTYDYLSKGFSVFWAYEEDFESDRFNIERMVDAFTEEDDPERAVAVGTASARDYKPSIRERTVQEQLVSPDTSMVTSVDELPIKDSDGHVLPVKHDCSHGFSEVIDSGSATDYFRCGDCYLTLYRGHQRIIHFNVHVRSFEELPPVKADHYDCVGVWEKDESRFHCISCGKEYDSDEAVILHRPDVEGKV